ncbi:hypothetical protein EVAR_12684_1 [Eumeta japonica]|uniref:Uncharacterized protein n=1 Tax=Eumeta variegata TaxID=151549 RepID=A0A4C1UN86_EUMVA|nr:hypothetical protein EVAR_12684_1 [Eumeta japonica]
MCRCEALVGDFLIYYIGEVTFPFGPDRPMSLHESLLGRGNLVNERKKLDFDSINSREKGRSTAEAEITWMRCTVRTLYTVTV